MKRSDVLYRYYDKIAADIVENYRHVLECDGRIQCQIYIWEDGELEHLEEAQGSNSWLQPKDWESRELFHIHTIEEPYFDPWDYTDHGKPDDEDKSESERQEIIDYLVDEYEANINDLMEFLIDGAKQEERYAEERYVY